MSRLYGEQHRQLQDEFATRKMADRVEELACKTEFDDESKGFIEHMDMFFLSTVDHQGRPTVSYKGGDAGFVKVIDSKTLAFPPTMVMACSFLWATSPRSRKLACCLFHLKRRIVSVCKALLPSHVMTH